MLQSVQYRSPAFFFFGPKEAFQVMFRLPFFLFVLVTCTSFASRAAASPVMIASDLQLFIDTRLISRMLGDIRLKMHPPIPKEIALILDAPWEGGMSGYVTVMDTGSGYRMYYRGGGETTEEVTALAESKDGIHWKRPVLGIHEFQGSRANNIVYKGRNKSYWESHNFTPFLDTNPNAPDTEKYKAIGLGRWIRPDGEDVKALVALSSPDGIHWKPMRDESIINDGSFDSQNVAFWDFRLNQYVCYFRDGRQGKRAVKRAVSPDFLNWSAGEWLEYPGRPLEQFYTNAILPYPRNANIYIGFPMRFVPERKAVGEDARPVDALSDAVFISSHDGITFDRTFMEAWLRPGLDPANWGEGHGNNTPAWGLLQTSQKEYSVYWCENYGQIPHIRRGTIRIDGFASINAGYQGGEVQTVPIVFEGRRLVINYSTSAVGSIQVEIRRPDGRAVPGFGFEECQDIYGDEINRTVIWGGSKTKPAALAGQPVQLVFRLKDADLYSFRFGP